MTLATSDYRSSATASMEPARYRSAGPTALPEGRRTVASRLSGFLADVRDGLITPVIRDVRHGIALVIAWFVDESEIVTGYYCAVCQDVHESSHRCPRELIGLCDTCKRVRKLDRFGNCVCGSSAVTERRLRWPEIPARIRAREVSRG